MNLSLDNLNFKDKIVAKFLFRSESLSIYNNMTIKQHINHGAIQNVCHLHNCIFMSLTSVTLCQFYSPIILLPTKNNKLWNERKEDFLYMWLLQRITLYQRRHNRIFRRLHIFRRNRIFRHMYISNNPYWQSTKIMIFLCEYYTVTSDTLIGS